MFIRRPGRPEEQSESYRFIQDHWKDPFRVMLLEVIYFQSDPATRYQLFELLKEKTKQDFDYDFNQWYEWLSNQKPRLHPQYARSLP